MRHCFVAAATAAVVLVLGTASAVAQTVSPAPVVAPAQPSLNNLFPSSPGWLARVRFEYLFDSDAKPRYALETTQAFFQTEDKAHTLFLMPRFSYRNNDYTLNIGAGYRYVPSSDWFFGVNAFYDRTTSDSHERLGFGGAIAQTYLTFRVNSYWGLSDWNTTGQSGSRRVQRKALNGVDAELDVPIPYLPWLRAAGTFYNWDGNNLADTEGWRGRFIMNVTGNVRLELGGTSDNVRDTAFLLLRLTPGQPTPFQYTALTTTVTDNAFSPRDMKRFSQDRITRSYDITTERRVAD